MNRILTFVLTLVLAACTRTPEKPKEESPAAEPFGRQEKSVIAMSEKAQGHIGLMAVTAKVQTLTEYLQVTGTVQPIGSKVAHVRSISSGRLISVQVKVGDRIAANDALATFDSTDASEIASQYQVSRSELDKLNLQLSVAKQQSERNRQLAEIGAIPRKEYDLSLAEEKSIAASIDTQQKVITGIRVRLQRLGFSEDAASVSTLSSVRAPFAGIVIKADAAPGEMIRPEDELFQIADTSQVWVQAEVFEKDLGRIQADQIASIQVDTYADREFLGKVTYISDLLDPQTRTARVRCEVANTDGLLKLDMFATVRLPTKFKSQGIAIPSEAIQKVSGKDVVFVRTGATTFEQRPVQIGKIIQGVTEILSGLQAGEAVVTQGAFHLKSIVLGDEIGEED